MIPPWSDTYPRATVPLAADWEPRAIHLTAALAAGAIGEPSLVLTPPDALGLVMHWAMSADRQAFVMLGEVTAAAAAGVSTYGPIGIMRPRLLPLGADALLLYQFHFGAIRKLYRSSVIGPSSLPLSVEWEPTTVTAAAPLVVGGLVAVGITAVCATAWSATEIARQRVILQTNIAEINAKAKLAGDVAAAQIAAGQKVSLPETVASVGAAEEKSRWQAPLIAGGLGIVAGWISLGAAFRKWGPK